MVKENNLIMENKKPFEIVQEVNNEIPSFEEFMKSYENDETIENSYYDEFRSYVDIRVPKFYGPGEEGDGLKIPCPAKNCDDGSRECKDGVHKRSECRNPTSYMKGSTEARLKCSYCNSPSHIRNGTFKCHRHNDFGPCDGTKFTRAISVAMRAKDTISEDFGNKLLDYLEDNPY